MLIAIIEDFPAEPYQWMQANNDVDAMKRIYCTPENALSRQRERDHL
jgi:hypothetical protein